VTRNLAVFAGDVIIEYATSDITALGVDKYKFSECMGIATNLRGPAKCGDYQQTSGNLLIPAGANSGGFKVPIMNDLCLEKFPKYIQVTLSIPGGASLQGEAMSTKIRIDDDDFLQNKCFWSD